MKIKDFDIVANIYDKSRPVSSEIMDFFLLEVESFLDRTHKKPPYRILSLGIGSGRAEVRLASNKIHLFGIDLQEKMLKQLKLKEEANSINIVQGDCCFLPFYSCFNLCVAIHLTHLVSDLNLLIEQIESVSNKFVQGDVFTALHENILFEGYSRWIYEMGWQKKDLGLRSEEFQDLMKEKGYTVEICKKEVEDEISLSLIYEIIEKKYLSSLWDLPEDIHQEAMKRLNQYIKNKDVKLAQTIKTKSKGILRFYSK